MEALRNWLNSARNYDEGVKLLVQYSSDAKLKRLFTTEAKSEFKQKLLLQKLQGLYTAGTTQQIVKEEQSQQVVQRVAVAHFGWPPEKDEVITALHAQWKPLFSELNALSSRIYDIAKAGNKTEAGAMAHRILDLDDQCDALYDKRDYYLQHGRLPEEKAEYPVVTDPLKFPLALSNAQRQLREARLRLSKNPNSERIAATIKKNEWYVGYYKQQLKLD